MKLRNSWHVVASTSWSILRREKLSFGQASVSEVDADPLLAIFLLYENKIGEPIGIESLSNEAGL